MACSPCDTICIIYTIVHHNNYKKILAEVQHGAGGQVYRSASQTGCGQIHGAIGVFPDTLLAKLEDVATQTGRTCNELVQMCIDYALARLEIPEE